MTRACLLSGTALIGILTLAFSSGEAIAACSTNTPTAGAIISCNGTDTTGVSGNVDNVSLTVNPSASINTTGVNAINLGFNSTITTNASSTVASNLTAINVTGGTVYANGTITGGGGTAINFGNSNANFNIYSTSNITGNVVAGSTADQFRLRQGGGTLNVNDIGTKYIGFDQFIKNDTGTWILTGTGNQAWNITGGTLQGNTTSMSGNLAVSSGANVTFDQASFGGTSGIISGAGSLTVSGSTLSLDGANTYTGGTTINAGANLQGTTSSITGNITNNSNLTFTQNTNGTYSGVVSGSGRINKYGTGTVSLTGANTYSGGAYIYAGALNISADNNLGTGSVILDGGRLQSGAAYTNTHAISLGANSGGIDTNGFNTTFSGVISGAGSLTKTGSGTLSLSGSNSFSGGLIISAGTVAATPGTLGTGNVANSGTLSINTASNSTYNAIISGTGNLLKQLAGTVTLTGASTYTGGTTILGGALNVSADNNIGAASSTLTLNGGTLQSGAAYTNTHAISLGASNGTIDTNGFNTTVSGIISGAGRLTKSGIGTLTLSGTNTYTGGTTITGGTVTFSSDNNLGATSGALTLDGGILRAQLASNTISSRNIVLGAGGGTIQKVVNGTTYNIAGTISGTGMLTVNSTGGAFVTLSGANTYSGGTTVSNSAINASADNNFGTGSIALNSGTLQSGAAYTNTHDILLGASNNAIDTNGFTTTASGVISGTGTLTKSGTGTLTLSGANTYSGGTNINQGTLAISSDSNLGSASANIAMSGGGTLLFTSGVSSARNISVVNAGIINTSSNNVTLSGAVSGSGELIKSGSGRLILSGTNTYSGGTSITNGIVTVSADSNLGTGSVTLNGGTLQSGAVYANTHAVSLGSSGGTIDTNGFNTTASGVISGTGVLTKTGTGTLTLSGSNTYFGNTLISGGTLSGNTASVRGNVAISSGANLLFDQSTDDSFSNIISGAGSLAKSGGGVLVLSGANTYTGGTTISSGALVVDSTTLPGNVTNNSLLAFSQASTGTYAGVISGSGSLLKAGAGTLILSGGNTYTGGTLITGGTLVGTTTSLQGDIANDSVLAFNQTANGIYASNISGTGSFIKAGSGNVTLTGLNTYSGGTTVSAGTLTGNTDSIQGDIDNNASVVFNQTMDDIYAGNMSGLGSLTKTGAGILTLTGLNNYSGGTTVSAGTLSGNTNTLQGDITNNSTLTFDQSFNGVYAGVISGTGSLIKSGNGNLILSGNNSYTGGTTISGGRLSINGTIAGTTTVGASGTLGGNGNFGIIIANGRIAPGNSIGTMNVTGPVTFNSGSVFEVEVNAAGNSDRLIATGAITINGGTVDIRAASGTYADTTVYNNIIQGLSRTGIFSGVTTDLMFLTPTLSYDATSVDLTLARNDVDFAVVADDEVQAGVANAVQDLGSGNDLYIAFSGLNMTEASAALDTLSGEHNAGITTATAQSASVIKNVITSRMQNLGSENIDDIAPAAGNDNNFGIKKNFWSEVFGSRGHSDSKDTAPAQNRESSGALFGGDAELADDVFIGAFGGYEIGEVYTDSQNANSDVDSYHAGIYASKNITPSWRISTSLIGSYHDISTTRHISFTGFSETPKGETNGYTITPAIETGYKLSVSNATLEPFMGLSLTHSYIDSYSEKDGGSANLDVDSVSQTNFSHVLGFRLGKSFQITDETDVSLTARAGWNHIYGDLDTSQTMQFSGGTTPFDVKGAGLARDSAVFGAGADIALGFSDATAYLNYAGEVSKDTDNHGVMLGIKVPF